MQTWLKNAYLHPFWWSFGANRKKMETIYNFITLESVKNQFSNLVWDFCKLAKFCINYAR